MPYLFLLSYGPNPASTVVFFLFSKADFFSGKKKNQLECWDLLPFSPHLFFF